MRKRAFLAGSVSVFLLLATLGVLFVMPVRAAKTWTVNDDGPADFSTIQAAINAADPGDIIQVKSGFYCEHVVVNKSLTLVGENKCTTIIDGNGRGIAVHVRSSDVEIRRFTVQNSGDFPNSTILLGSCARNTIHDSIIRDNAFGIELHRCDDSIIIGNKIMNSSWAGIYVLDDSNDNIILYNTMVNNSVGVWVASDSSFNTFYYNDFINNKHQVEDFALTTKWDDGAGRGNYWSDYTGKDLDMDGVGDTLLPHQGVDWYPLMHMYGDVNGDDVVDNLDLIQILINLGPVPPKPPACDVNGDMMVNVIDLVIVLLNIGKTNC